MLIIKYLILTIIFLSSCYVGMIISNKYKNRVDEIKEMKSALSIFIAKIKLTYEPIPQIFDEIASNGKTNINNIFKMASNNMKEISAGKAWKRALKERQHKFE